MKRITSLQPLNTDLGILLLRLLFGGLFVFHGYQKIDGFSQYSGMMPDYLGIGGKLTYILVIMAEFGCGFLVAIGFLTRLAVIPIMVVMAVAFLVAHSKDNFVAKELVFVFLVLSIIIFILGSGRYSVDRAIFNKNKL
jgi:putative oxidoreductase